MAGSVAGVYAVLQQIEDMLQSSLATYLNAIETDRGTSFGLSAPDVTRGYVWGKNVVPQHLHNGIQLYVQKDAPRRQLVKQNAAIDHDQEIVVRWYFLARRNETGKRQYILGRAAERVINEKWHTYSSGGTTNPASVIEMFASVDYDSDSLALADQTVPGSGGVGATSGTQHETIDIRVTCRQRVAHTIT